MKRNVNGRKTRDSSVMDDETRLVAATETVLKTNNLTPLVKEELRLSIMAKRHRRGETDLVVEFKEPERHELTEEEKAKKQRRREQNRRAARKCRLKKRMNQSNTVQHFDLIERRNTELENEIQHLREEKLKLEIILNDHACSGKCYNVKTETPSAFRMSCTGHQSYGNRDEAAISQIANLLMRETQTSTSSNVFSVQDHQMESFLSLPGYHMQMSDPVIPPTLDSVPEDRLPSFEDCFDFKSESRRPQALSTSSSWSESESIAAEAQEPFCDIISNALTFDQNHLDDDVFSVTCGIQLEEVDANMLLVDGCVTIAAEGQLGCGDTKFKYRNQSLSVHHIPEP